jgi:hypothetical protein
MKNVRIRDKKTSRFRNTATVYIIVLPVCMLNQFEPILFLIHSPQQKNLFITPVTVCKQQAAV